MTNKNPIEHSIIFPKRYRPPSIFSVSSLMTCDDLLVSVYEIPVPGIPTVLVFFPVVEMVCLYPRPPKVMLVLLRLKFTRTPGRIFTLLLNLKLPIISHPFSPIAHNNPNGFYGNV